MKEKSENKSFWVWIYVLMLALLVISKCTSDDSRPSDDLSKLHMQTMPKINAAIEQEDIRRQTQNAPPLSNEEIQDIVGGTTSNEIKRMDNK